jgi:hypothetical protein
LERGDREKYEFFKFSEFRFLHLPAVWPGTLSIAKPLSVGQHRVEVYWVFSAMHCDGLDGVIEENCIGPGEIGYAPPRVFEVTPGAAP